MRYACLFGLLLPLAAFAAPREVTFSQSAESVEAYDFVEVTANVAAPDAANPFMDATLAGSFGKTGETARAVEGFCDSPDGSVFRIRFMPSSPGDYTYSITYRQGGYREDPSGGFPRHRRPPARADPRRPEIPLALHLGRHRRALFLQRHHRLLADGLAGGPTSSSSASSGCAG